MVRFAPIGEPTDTVSFSEAVLRGMGANAALYMPTEIPKPDASELRNLRGRPLAEVAAATLTPWLEGELSTSQLLDLAEEVFSFPLPIVRLDDTTAVVELFHGPTLSFKDFGARFLSRFVGRVLKREATVLVATSGDTGSAVADAFSSLPGMRVVLLYPSGGISRMQEMQLTTFGRGVTALEVEGTFDDCQRLVKEAFADLKFSQAQHLLSANSINLGRLLPQMVYYVSAAAEFQDNQPLVMSVPSGNFGNLTAGLFARAMGAPISRFVAATNMNDVVPQYLSGAEYMPRPSVKTLSNAMDVGAPSNFSRIQSLFKSDRTSILDAVDGERVTDSETEVTIRDVHGKTGYLLDPHGAVGYAALRRRQHSAFGLVMGTAHPAKFAQDVERIIGASIPLPHQLTACLSRTKRSTKIPPSQSALRDIIQSR